MESQKRKSWAMAIRERFNLDAEVELYMSSRPRWGASSFWNQLPEVAAQVTQHAGMVNWGFMVFLLSGFGTYMKPTLFWVSFTLVAIETIVLSTLQPFFSWLEDEVLRRPPPEQHPSDTTTFIWQRAAAAKLELGTTTIVSELIMFYKLWTPLLKLTPVILLLVFIDQTGDLCAPDSTCFHRLEESLIVMVIIFFVFEWLPFHIANKYTTTDIPTLLASIMKLTDIWVTILRDACTLFGIEVPRALTHRVLSDSISLTETVAWEIRLMRARAVDRAQINRITDEIWRQELYKMVAFFSSSFSAVLTLTVALLVGGSFGSFMTRKTYWVCWAFVTTEAFAESLLYIGQGSWMIRLRVRLTWLLRFVAHGLLFGLMVDVIARREYYAEDIRPECDELCQQRGSELLKVAVVLSGIQCLSFVTSMYAWHALTMLHLVASVENFVFRRVMNVVGIPSAVLFGYVVPKLCRGVIRSLLWCRRGGSPQAPPSNASSQTA